MAGIFPDDFGISANPVLQINPLSGGGGIFGRGSIGRVTPQQFEAAAKSGAIRPANDTLTDLKNILYKKVPATDFQITQGHPLAEKYESGQLTAALKNAGLHVSDDMMGNLFVGTTPENLNAIMTAKTPLQFGRAYGYSDNDIAAFYLKRAGGDTNAAYRDFLTDSSQNTQTK